MNHHYEIIRRWHHGDRISRIASQLGFDRKTVRHYIQQAQAAGLEPGKPLPAFEALAPEMAAWNASGGGKPKKETIFLDPLIDEYRTYYESRTCPLKPKSIYEALAERYGWKGRVSYSTFKRWVRRNKLSERGRSRRTCRIEGEPGEEVQIDYGYMGRIWDDSLQRHRKVYAFIGALAWSRHKYVEFVHSQDQRSFVASHLNMWTFFGGVTERVNLDNLKSGVIQPDLYDPVINRGYAEMAHHFGCFIDPCRVADPQGKVERDVITIHEAFRTLLAKNSRLNLGDANRQIQHWLLHTYGRRKHSTTGEFPMDRFKLEATCLRPLPAEAFALARWKEAKVHSDSIFSSTRTIIPCLTPMWAERSWSKPPSP